MKQKHTAVLICQGEKQEWRKQQKTMGGPLITEPSCYAAFPLCGTGLREKISVSAPFNEEIVGRWAGRWGQREQRRRKGEDSTRTVSRAHANQAAHNTSTQHKFFLFFFYFLFTPHLHDNKWRNLKEVKIPYKVQCYTKFTLAIFSNNNMCL